MFARRYFGGRYFAPVYWGDGGDGVPPEPQPEAAQFYSGGWERAKQRAKSLHNLYPQQTDEERREERERLGIIPREQKKLDRAAKSIAKRIDPGQSAEQIAAEVMRAKEFDGLMSDISARNQEIIDGLDGMALLMAHAIQYRILQELQDEDDAIAMLLLEM